jgi:hypothetical protein
MTKMPNNDLQHITGKFKINKWSGFNFMCDVINRGSDVKENTLWMKHSWSNELSNMDNIYNAWK